MKKIVVLSVIALILIGIVAISTHVLSSDAAAFSNEGFSPGTLVIRLSGADSHATGPTTAGFGGTGLVPGSVIGPATYYLTNTGAGAGDHVEVGFRTTFADNQTYDARALGPNIVDMNTQIVVTDLTYGPVSLLATIDGRFSNAAVRRADGDQDGVLTMSELNGTVLEDLAPPAPGGAAQKFTIAAVIPESVGNGIQGDQASTTVTFRLFNDPAEHLASRD
jgi:hypothetical protein